MPKVQPVIAMVLPVWSVRRSMSASNGSVAGVGHLIMEAHSKGMSLYIYAVNIGKGRRAAAIECYLCFARQHPALPDSIRHFLK